VLDSALLHYVRVHRRHVLPVYDNKSDSSIVSQGCLERSNEILRNVSFGPLAPLALDLPRYVPRYLLYVSAIGWFPVPILSFLAEIVEPSVKVVKPVILLFTTSIVSIGVFKPRLHSDLHTRAGVNLVYFGQCLSFPWWSPRDDW
jgi:hypothetical protein